MTPSVLGDRYRLGERIADGGMGSVFRAIDQSLRRSVAVKVLRRELADDPTFLERFRREARGDDVGPAADQYSLGCVLFEAVTGRTPYDGATAVAIATKHVSAPVPDPRQDRPDLPVPAAALIRRALAKDPSARFPSATAMADALAAVRDEVAGAPDPGRAAPERAAPERATPSRSAPRAPGREGSPMPDEVGPAVHSPSPGAGGGAVHSPPPAPGSRSPGRSRPGWRWRRSS